MRDWPAYWREIISEWQILPEDAANLIQAYVLVREIGISNTPHEPNKVVNLQNYRSNAAKISALEDAMVEIYHKLSPAGARYMPDILDAYSEFVHEIAQNDIVPLPYLYFDMACAKRQLASVIREDAAIAEQVKKAANFVGAYKLLRAYQGSGTREFAGVLYSANAAFFRELATKL